MLFLQGFKFSQLLPDLEIWINYATLNFVAAGSFFPEPFKQKYNSYKSHIYNFYDTDKTVWKCFQV